MILDNDAIKRMQRRQRLYDDMVFRKMGMKSYDEIPEDKIKLAIFDELGELNHELKPEWCWWKKSSDGIDDKKVLSEWADAMHFALLWHNKREKDAFLSEAIVLEIYTISQLMGEMITDINYGHPEVMIEELVLLGEKLNFSPEQLENAYFDKNNENILRALSDY